LNYLLGIDVGGTFTDFIEVDRDGNVRIVKTPSTPARPADGVLEGLRRLAEESATIEAYLSAVELIVHGTTITTNAVITGNYAKTGYVTTKGFRDILNSRRGLKRNAFTAKESPPKPIVPQHLVRTVDERLDRDGNVLVALDEDDVRAAAAHFREEGVKAVAVNYLFSFLDGTHEARTREILEDELPGAYITISSRVLPQVRMYERGSTTVFNACVGPLLRAYITDLQDELASAGFAGRLLTMQSNGGVMSPEVVKDFGANTLLSGPASGPVAALFFARPHRLVDLITLDMGGTSLDVCLVRDGRASITNASEVGEYSLALPSLDINAMGAGGGSIASVDDGGMLTVGPESAGAQPGPVAYGMGGTRPTVTDANLVLGRLAADRFLGGDMKLDLGAAERAIKERIADPLGMDVIAAADGILKIAATAMSYAVKAVSTERGLDAASFAMVAFGGAGPLHASDVAREIGMGRIIVPQAPGHFSAFGMLFSDLRYDYVRTHPMRLADADFANIEPIYAEMEDAGRAAILRTSVNAGERTVQRAADMRYVGQEHAVTVELPLALFETQDRDGIKAEFDRVHEIRYGTSAPAEQAEIVSLRSAVTGAMQKPPLEPIAAGAEAPAETARTGSRRIYFSEAGEFVETPAFDRTHLKAGNRIDGPAVIDEHASTTLAAPGDRVSVDAYGNLLISAHGVTE
jgi:N-methylhydantoinase A